MTDRIRLVADLRDLNTAALRSRDDRMLAALKHIGCVIPADRGEGGA